MRIRLVPVVLVLTLSLSLSGCTGSSKSAAEAFTNEYPAVRGAPTVVDLGSDQCDTCKKMVPVLAQLTRDYQGRLNVQFIDVYKEPAKSRQFRVQAIPTQVFLSAQGYELYRHVGYLSYADMVATLKRLGVVK